MANKGKRGRSHQTKPGQLPTLPKLTDQYKLARLPKLKPAELEKLKREQAERRFIPLFEIPEGWIVGDADGNLDQFAQKHIPSSHIDPTLKHVSVIEGDSFRSGQEVIRLQYQIHWDHRVVCGYGRKSKTWVTRGDAQKID